MATQHNFRIKNGLEVGGVLIVNSSGQLQAASISGAISATSIGVTNIVTNKVVKFNGSILDDSNITDTGSLITLGSNTAVTGAITATTVNTGQGATEVHLMNQNVRTTDSPTFDELTVTDFVRSTGNNLKFSAGGTHVLNIDLNGKIYPNTHNAYDIGFNSSTAFRHAYFSGTGNFANINTGQGATEVHLMNQNVRTSDSPTFQDLTVQGNLSITGDINSYNVTDLDVTDKTITVGSGQTEANSGGSGLIVDGSGAQMLWDEGDNRFEFNKNVYTTGQWQGNGSGLNTLNASNLSSGTVPEPRLPTQTKYLRSDVADSGGTTTGSSLNIPYLKTNMLLVDATNFGDTINGAPWYGLGKSTLVGYHSNNATMSQLANYWGLRLQTQGARIDMTPTGYAANILFGGGTDVSGTTWARINSTGLYQGLSNLVWHAGNDGSGSTLDADLLDGQQGSYYAPFAGSTSFRPVTAGLYGTGHGSSMLPIWQYNSGHHGYGFGYVEGSPDSFRFDVSNDLVSGTPDFEISENVARVNGNTVWHAGNDGSSSGLDADLLDGQHGSYYAPASHGHSYLPLTGGTVSGTTSFSYLTNTGGSKLEVMGGADGNQRGIYIWDTSDSNWGIYMAQAGANKSLAGGTACNSLDGRTSHHIRFRTYGSDAARGWIFENNLEAAKVSITSDTGKIYSTGDHYVGSNVVWHAGNDGPGSGLDADTLDGYQKADINPAHSHYRWTNISASSTQARRFVIMRLYACPAHWDGGWQDIHLKVWSESYEATNLKYEICGDYAGAGTQATMFKLRLKDAGGSSEHGRFRLVLGTPVDAGWDYSGADTYYVDVYAEASHYMNFTVAADFYSAGFNVNTLPTSGGATTVVYSSPTVSNITTFNEAKEHSYFANHKIWNDGNHGSASGLDADLLDGQHGSYYAPASHNHSGVYLPISGKAADSELLDGINSTSFLRSDATDTATGAITLSSTANHFNGHHYFDSFDANGNHYPHYLSGSSNNGAQVNLRVQQSGGGGYDVLYIPNGSNNITWRGNNVWNAGNDGSGSGLDADTVDGKHKDFLMHYKGAVSGNWDTIFSQTDGHMGVYQVTNISNTDSNYPSGAYTYGGVMSWQLDDSTFKLYAPHIGQLHYQTGWNNDEYSGWRKIWDTGNDGSGSGLDADLLDGQHGSYYYAASNPNGYTNDQTAAEILAALKTVDVNGTAGVNAGTFDGVVSTSFLRSDTSDTMTGELNVTRNGGSTGSTAPQYSNANIELETTSNHAPAIGFHRGGYSATTLYEYDGELYTNAWTTRAQTGKLVSSGNIGSYAWTSSNDGSGSTLDADLLDGQHGSYYAPASGGNYWPTSGSWWASNMPGSRARGTADNGGEVVVLQDNPSTGRSSMLVDGQYYAGENGGFYSLYSGNNYNLKSGWNTNTSGHLLFSTQGHAQFNTQFGNLQIGPMNASYCHIYTNIAGGFYFNRTALYANGNTMWHAGNDGSGSGLDADLFDGADSGVFLKSRGSVNVTSSSGGSNTNPFDDAHTETKVAEYGTRLISYTGASATMLTIATGGSASVFQIGAHYNGTDFYMRTRTDSSNWQTWKKLWHNGNDGSSSGLDADLLDGQEGSYYAPASHVHSYLPLAGGTITGNLNVNGTTTLGNGSIVDALIGTVGTSTAYNAPSTGALYFGSKTNGKAYSINSGALENIGGNYTKLHINWHTGIKIGAAYNYGGIRFFNNSLDGYTPAMLFSIGNTDQHVRATNNFYSGGEIHATTSLTAPVYKVGTTTVIDASRNLTNVNLVKFRDHTSSFYISPTNTNTLNAGYSQSGDTADMWINYRGYLDGVTQFRDFRIGDGKNNCLLFVDGSARAFDFQTSSVLQMGGTTVIDSSRVVSATTVNIAGTSATTKTLTVNSSHATNAATIVVGNTVTDQTLVDGNTRPMVVIDGKYPVLNLNHTVTSNSNHGPTIQFTYDGYSTNRQVLIGTDGQGQRIDFGFSGGTSGTNSDKNPHNGISGYSGVTPMRVFPNGVLIGSTGVYPNEITSIASALTVQGNTKLNSTIISGLSSGTGTACTHIEKIGGIRLGWDNATYGVQDSHSIRSTYGDTYGDDITINSYHHMRFNIDSNNNNSDDVFQVGRHTTGTANILMTLDTSGNLSTSGNITAYSSDRRLKKNFKPIENALDKVLSLNGYNFDWRMEKLEGTTFEPEYETNDVGLIAQEVQAVCEQAAGPAPFDIQYNEKTKKHESQSGEDYLTVNYDKLVPLLVEAIKEQQNKIDKLEELINNTIKINSKEN